MRVQAGSGFDDMQLLKKIVSDVDVLLFVAKTYRRPNYRLRGLGQKSVASKTKEGELGRHVSDCSHAKKLLYSPQVCRSAVIRQAI